MAYLAFPEISKRLGANEQEPGVPNAPTGAAMVGGGGASGGVGSGGSEEMRSKSPDAFFKANVGTGSADITGQFRQDLEKGKEGVANSLNEWKSKLPGTGSISSDDLNAGISGNADKYQAISNRLSSNFSAPQYNYNPSEIKNANLLTQGVRGTEQLLRQTQGPGYTQGMARLDARLNQMDPGYKQNISSVISGIGDLQKSAGDAKTQASSLADQARSAYDAETGKLKDTLGGLGKGLRSQFDSALAQANLANDNEFSAGRAGYLDSAGLSAPINQNYQTSKKEAEEFLNNLKRTGVQTGVTSGQSKAPVMSNVNPAWYKDLEVALTAGPKLGSFVNAQKGSVGLGDVVSQGDRSKYAAIDQLLGGNLEDLSYNSGSKNQFGFDSGGYNAAQEQQAQRIQNALAKLRENIASGQNQQLATSPGGTAPRETDIGSGGYIKLPSGRVASIYYDQEAAEYAKSKGLRD